MIIARMAVLMALLIAQISAMAQEISVEEDAPPQTHAELEASFTNILNESNIPGAQIVLIENGDVSLSYNYGVSNIGQGTPVTDETVFRAGSISKSFIGVAVMMAQEEGLLSLDMPIAEATPDVEFANGWERDNPVTIAHVLEHTAGFYDITLAELIMSEPDMSIVEGLALNPYTRVSRWSPGTYSSYANSGPPIAAHAVELFRNTNYDDLLRDTILRPLGMSVSDLRLTPEVAARITESYQGTDLDPVPYGHIIIRPSGALNTTATELAQFVRMMINRGELNGTRFLTPASVERIERSETLQAATYHGLQPTYGFGNDAQFTERMAFRGHGGGIDGFIAIYIYSAELRSGAVIMINNAVGRDMQALLNAASGYLTRNHDPVLPDVYPVPPEELAAYAGYYVDSTPRSGFARLVSTFSPPTVASYDAVNGFVVAGTPRVPDGEYTMRRAHQAESSFARAQDRSYRRELRYANFTLVQISLPQLILRLGLSYGVGVGALMALLYGFIFTPIGFVRNALKRDDMTIGQGPKYMRLTALLSGLSVAGVLAIGFYASSLHYLDLTAIATMGPLSLSLFTLTLLAPAFAAMGLWVAITGSGETDWWKRSYFILANGLILAGLIWLSQFGWFGLKTWIL